jgi:ATP-dependent RNA helicase RhlE
VPKERQTMLFSATIPKTISELASNILHCPEEISIKETKENTNKIKQLVYHVKTSHRRQLLQYLVKKSEFSSIIVFVKTRSETEFIMEYIKSAKITCDYINKDKTQNARQKALKSLKDGEIKVLVATDIASR